MQRDLARLNEQMTKLFPGENIEAQSNGKAVVLSGLVTSKDAADKAVNVAAGYVDKAGDVVNLLQLQETQASNQVLLRVRFAEVSRSAMTELGVDLFTSPTGIKNTLGRTTTQQFAAPGFDGLEVDQGERRLRQRRHERRRQVHLQRLPEPVPLQPEVRHRRDGEGALRQAACSRAWPSRTWWRRAARKRASSPAAKFPIPVAQGTGGNVAISVSSRSSASA